MIRSEIKNCNFILSEEQQKSQRYQQGNLININILKKNDRTFT